MILESVENGPLIWPTIEENGVTRTKKYAEISAAEKIQADYNMKATNIILQGLPTDIYSLMNHHRVAKDLWERVQLLMQGTSLTKQEREGKLYDIFDKFTHIKRESLHNLPTKWSKFVTDVKLVKDLHTTNFDQLHAYLEPHKLHANEVHLLRERNQDPLAFVANHQTSTLISLHTTILNFNNNFHHLNMDQFIPINIIIYLSITTLIQSVIRSTIISISVSNESSNLICFAIPVFSPGDDPIACLNKAMAFLTVVASSRFPLTNNQLRTSSNPRNQATIQDGRVTVVKCSNYQGEGHMARKCTQPKRRRNATWYKEKAMLAEAQEAGQILDEEQLAFLADPRVPDCQAVQTIIPNNAAFQTEDLDTYDSDCDDILNAKAVLMSNISNYGSNVVLEVPHSETYLNDMDNQSVHAIQDFEQTPVVDVTNNEITSDSNIIPYS
ncbi:hypothetical protein Tco_1007603 [Tanacetum coccineum]